MRQHTADVHQTNLAIDSGLFLHPKYIRAVIAAWLNTCKRSRSDVHLSMSARELSVRRFEQISHVFTKQNWNGRLDGDWTDTPPSKDSSDEATDNVH